VCGDVVRADPADTWRNCLGYLQKVDFWPLLSHSIYIFGKTVVVLHKSTSLGRRSGVPQPTPATAGPCPALTLPLCSHTGCLPTRQREGGVPGQSHKSHWKSLTHEMN